MHISRTKFRSLVWLTKLGLVVSVRIPKSSVLEVNCKSHELDNLYVIDTSFFVSIGAVNPSLTAMANAIRVGEHLAGRLK